MKQVKIEQLLVKAFHGTESVKALRTNLLFSGMDVKAVALTSYYSADGKSSIAFQLAASLAQNGKKTLLLDTDLRNSSLARNVGLSSQSEGLSHYLSGMAALDDLIYETDVPGFSLILSGVRVPNPAELLGSSRFSELITKLKEVYDYIIVDAAPIGQVIDCAVMAPVVDGILLVINVQKNSSKLSLRIKNQLEKVGGKVLGVVLNKVDFNEKYGYYGKVYGKEYGRGYGK